MKKSAFGSLVSCLRLSPQEQSSLLQERGYECAAAAAHFRAMPLDGRAQALRALLDEVAEFGDIIRCSPPFDGISADDSSPRDFLLLAVIPAREEEALERLFQRPFIERCSFIYCRDRAELAALAPDAEPIQQVIRDDEELLDQARSFILSMPQREVVEVNFSADEKQNLQVVTLAAGFKAGGVYCGIKSGKRDLGILFSENPTVAAGRFTKNRFCSAPVQLCKEHLDSDDVRAIVVNSGVANAATGSQGLADARKMADLTAHALGLSPNQVLVCSTGVIGKFLPMEKVEAGIRGAADSLDAGRDEHLLASMMTTDTVMKYASRRFMLGGREVCMGGMTKGAGMIHPNMATMLAFITTDAAITRSALDQALGIVTQETFNCLTVDGDTSTSDSVLVLANGKAGNDLIRPDHAEFYVFIEELRLLCQDLVRQMARDGEGATHLVRVVCEGALNRVEAVTVAKAIAGSLLVKTALFGHDPNWGRIICAVGNTTASYRPEDVRLWVQGIPLFENGMAMSFNAGEVSEAMKKEEVEVRVNLGAGNASITVYTCDLSYDYVRINAEYHT